MAPGSSHNSEWLAYEVFLSFRGEDVRKSFIDHLHWALKREGITTFYDDTGLERGEEIQSKLYEAIESSKIAIVTFSRKYATSRWCLDELLKIEERRSHGLIVLPVFYDVDPTDVRHQSGPYEEAFCEHVAKYGSQQLNKWKQAFRSVADLAGFGLQNQANGYEARFIEHIVKKVVRRLDARQLDIPNYMVGKESFLVQRISKWLQNGSSQVEVGIIHGPAGVGKTTTAKVVYNENYSRFVSSTFLVDVRTAQGKDIEFIRLQKQLIRNITGIESINIDSVHHGKQKIRKAIGNKAILVVLDDVDEVGQFLGMFVCPDWFFSGSKILMTTRNQYLLINDLSVRRFEACLLDEEKSIELFSSHAFGQAYLPLDYITSSMPFIKYCGGLPLALEVLASSLRSIKFDMWELEFARLPQNLDEKVHNVLKWSFDSIQQSSVKDIFLHIAFFMVGMKKEYALKILDGCGLNAEIGLENLIGKCLVSVRYSDTLMMHQLIQQMGYEVVRQNSPDELGCRSRLLGSKDAYEVLKKKTGTSAIKGLHFDIPDARDSDISSEENSAVYSAKRRRTTYMHANSSQKVPQRFRPIKTDAFTKMDNLDLLLLENVQLDGGFEDFPKGIKWLLWLGCSLKEIPLEFDFDELVILDMQKSCLVHVWNGSKYVGALKILNLSHSHHLRSTPDLSSAHILEWISCEDCTSLVEVHESIGNLENLTYLNLDGCINLVTWHKSMENLKKLTRLSAKGCRNLRNLPINFLGSVEWLDLEGCSSLFKAWNQVESSGAVLESSSNIIIPAASYRCPNKSSLVLDSVPCPISPLPFNVFLPSLKRLNLANCGISRDDVMEMISWAPSLEDLDLSHNPIRILSNMSRRVCLKLRSLKLVNCGISRVDAMGVMSLTPSLHFLDLSHNPIHIMSNMRSVCLKLKSLTLVSCGISREDVILELISHAPSLEHLDLSHNPIRILSNRNRIVCCKLRSLKLVNCGISRVDDMGMMSCAPSVKDLDLSHNPIRVMSYMNRGRPFLELGSLTLNDCPNLHSISNIVEGCSLRVMGSHSLKRITYYRQSIIKEKLRFFKGANDFRKHDENEYGDSGTAVVERISEMTEERAKYLGFPNLNTIDHAGTGPVSFSRGIYQAGMYSVYLRGNHLAEWFPTTTTFKGGKTFRGGSVVRYRVPSFHPNERPIRALNIGFLGAPGIFLIVKNVSRMWSWRYRDLWAIGSAWGAIDIPEGIMWLSHWCVAEHRQIKSGDVLEIKFSNNCENMGVKVIYEEEAEHLNGEGAEKDKDEFCCMGKSVDSSNSCNNNQNKVMNSSKVSTSDDNEGSATTSDVAVWYNNIFRSHDLSLYFDGKRVEQEKDEKSSCDATAAYLRTYHINPHIWIPSPQFLSPIPTSVAARIYSKQTREWE